MHKFPSISILSALLALSSPAFMLAEEAAPASSEAALVAQEASTPIEPFTGKVNRNKVRVRQQPNLESPILKELSQGDLVIVLGEDDEFYALRPPAGIKGYVFRTFVLDNVVEGSRVNIRLEPDLNSPIIAQLNTGDRVNGAISSANSKWLEISLPENARFYVAKEYIEKIGDVNMMARIEKRRDEVNRLLNTTYLISQTEMQKSFPEIQLEGIVANYNKVIKDYTDFPEQTIRAKELLSLLQDNYIQKKITYLEAQNKVALQDLHKKETLLKTQENLAAKKGLGKVDEEDFAIDFGAENGINSKMAEWAPIENNLYEAWATEHYGQSQEDFYLSQAQQTISLKGIVEAYSRSVKNKPGDYLLINQSNHLPIAYLYSTKINLQPKLGHEVTIHAVPRPNNNFAYPAYFVLSVD